jgi:hypothetical protein
MKSFLNWLEDAVASPAATTTSSGSPGATISTGIAPYLRPIGIGSVVRRQFPGDRKHRKHRHKKHRG